MAKPQVRTYHLPPTPLIPNSPLPLLHYPSLLSSGTPVSPVDVHRLMSGNNWGVQWIFRYGPTQASHYHSAAHECMAVLTGSATIRFGAADITDDNGDESKEEGGVMVQAQAGDVFVLPAGTAHKTYNTQPPGEFALLTPGDGKEVLVGEEARAELQKMHLDGFTMMGSYPLGSSKWDFKVGGEDVGAFEKVWAVEKPELDPVLGKDDGGLLSLWK